MCRRLHFRRVARIGAVGLHPTHPPYFLPFFFVGRGIQTVAMRSGPNVTSMVSGGRWVCSRGVSRTAEYRTLGRRPARIVIRTFTVSCLVSIFGPYTYRLTACPTFIVS